MALVNARDTSTKTDGSSMLALAKKELGTVSPLAEVRDRAKLQMGVLQDKLEELRRFENLKKNFLAFIIVITEGMRVLR